MKIAYTIDAESPAGGSVRCEIASGGQHVRITATKKGIEQVVELDSDTVMHLREKMFDVFVKGT